LTNLWGGGRYHRCVSKFVDEFTTGVTGRLHDCLCSPPLERIRSGGSSGSPTLWVRLWCTFAFRKAFPDRAKVPSAWDQIFLVGGTYPSCSSSGKELRAWTVMCLRPEGGVWPEVVHSFPSLTNHARVPSPAGVACVSFTPEKRATRHEALTTSTHVHVRCK